MPSSFGPPSTIIDEEKEPELPSDPAESKSCDEHATTIPTFIKNTKSTMTARRVEARKRAISGLALRLDIPAG